MKSRPLQTRMLVISGIVSLVFFTGCGGSSKFNNQPPSPNAVPTISSLSPSSTQVGGQAFTLLVLGSNFVSSSVLRWNGSDRPTTFDNGGQLSAQISASDIATVGTAVITVFNPTPSKDTSNAVKFTINNGTNNGTNPSSIALALDPTGKFGKFVYVTNFGSNSVSMYRIDAVTGALEARGTVAAGSSPLSVAVDPSGRFTYVANNFSDNTSMYKVDATNGMLTSNGVVGSRGRNVSVTVHPSGNFAYVGNGCRYAVPLTLDSVSIYAVDTTKGALTSIGTIHTAATGSSACSIRVGVTVDRSGGFAYVTSDGCGLDTYFSYVSIYKINPTTGALEPVGQTVVSSGCASSLSVHPSGNFAYVPDDQNNSVSMYAIDATTGALTFLETVAAGSSPSAIAIDPSGNFAYVTNWGSNDVSMYGIDAAGDLTPMGTIAAGSSPSAIAIDPSGNFAYVTNSGSNNVSIYRIDSTTGALTLIGTIGT